MTRSRWIAVLAVAVAWLAAVSPPAQAQDQPVSLEQEADALVTEYEAVVAELRQLQARLNRDTAPEINLEQRRDYADDVLELRRKLAALREKMTKLRERLARRHEVRPLKLVKVYRDVSGSHRQRPPVSGFFRQYDDFALEYNSGSAGYTTKYFYKGKQIAAFRLAVTYAPLEIIPGKPFHIESELSYTRADGPMVCGRVPLVNQMLLGSGHYRLISKQDINECTGPQEKLALRLIPLKKTEHRNGGLSWSYTAEAASDGKLGHGQSKFEPGRYIGDISSYTEKIIISVRPWTWPDDATGGIILVYRPLKAGEQAIAALPPVPPPLRVIASGSGGSGGPGGPGSEGPSADVAALPPGGPGGPGTGGPGGGGTGPGSGSGQGSGGGPATQVANVPTGPGAVDASRPDVAALITEFLSVAEPFQNATEGASFRFDQWGDLAGTAIGGVALPRPARPDNVGARTPARFAWEERRFIDSVDHCTLEKYVVARLRGGPPAGCAGRHKGTVAKVVGLSSGQAKAKIKPFRFKVRLRPGDAAPSAGKSGTVQRQEPAPGTKLGRGEQVTLWIHAPFVDQRTVPDLAGLSSKQAKNQIRKAGLKATVKLGRAATSRENTGKVASQKPAAGTKVKAGSRVVVRVFTPYAANQRTVPDLAGLTSRQAKKRIKAAGLIAKVKPGPMAASRADAGKVAEQKPDPGTRVRAGSQVQVRVFTPPVDAGQVPNLVGLTFDQARTRLAGAGLTAERRSAGRPSSPNNADKVTGQKPAAGTRVKRGHRVILDVFSAYVARPREPVVPQSRCPEGLKWVQQYSRCMTPQQIARDDCGNRLSGSVPIWDGPQRGYRCGCDQGFSLNQQKTRCLPTNVVKLIEKDRGQKACARDYPGSILGKVNSNGKFVCSCPRGREFNRGRTACIITQAAANQDCGARARGSIARRNAQSGTYECHCTGGQVWDNRNKLCTARVAQPPPPQPPQNARDCETKYMYIENFRRQGNQQWVRLYTDQARRLGCDPKRIAKALGSGGDGAGGASGGDAGRCGSFQVWNPRTKQCYVPTARVPADAPPGTGNLFGQ